MSCSNPRPGILIPSDTSSTGQKMKFLSGNAQFMSYPELKAKYGDSLVMIPCGVCDNCIEQRTKAWAIRCSLEAGYYTNNCFLTLTYNDKCLPKFGLCKKDLHRFIKHLRNKVGAGIRYYGCGEYGSSLNTERPHYHLILFNYFPEDAEKVAVSPFGGFYYKSKFLQSLWKFGFVSVGEVSYNSCAYVARYCQKKIARDYGVVGKTPEFSVMSRRPGLGERYFKEHFDSLVKTDRIYAAIGNKYVFSSFRYFDKLIEKINPDLLQDLKSVRIRNGEINVASEMLSRNLPSMEHYFQYLERSTGEKYDKLRRNLK